MPRTPKYALSQVVFDISIHSLEQLIVYFFNLFLYTRFLIEDPDFYNAHDLYSAGLSLLSIKCYIFIMITLFMWGAYLCNIYFSRL